MSFGFDFLRELDLYILLATSRTWMHEPNPHTQLFKMQCEASHINETASVAFCNADWGVNQFILTSVQIKLYLNLNN